MELALIIAIFIGSVNAACPSNFVASTTIPGKCYYLTATRRTFFSAVNYCRNLTCGADILSITNESEDSEVASLMQSQGISRPWVGIAFYDNKSHWIATAAGSSNYSNLGSGTHNGYAALIASSGDWISADANYVICQIYPDDPTTFPPPQITCPDGWTPSISVRGKCYQWIYTDQTDFFSATRRCLTTRIGDSHAELVTLTSQLEMMELFAAGFGVVAWASLTRWEADGHWRWVETLHPTGYFGPYGQPKGYGGGTCAYFASENFRGEPCRSRMPTICQYFPDEPPAPTLSDLICPQNGIASITKPGTCYYVLSQRQSFQSARSACRALDTGFKQNDIFVPRTSAEYEEFEWIVRNQISHQPFWLGLTSSNGNWDWISGRSSNITNMWCRGQPGTSQNPNDQCAFVNPLNPHNQICWVAEDCTHSYVAVCQSSNTF